MTGNNTYNLIYIGFIEGELFDNLSISDSEQITQNSSSNEGTSKLEEKNMSHGLISNGEDGIELGYLQKFNK